MRNEFRTRSSIWNTSNFCSVRWTSFDEASSIHFARSERCDRRDHREHDPLAGTRQRRYIFHYPFSLGREFNEHGVGRENDFVIYEMQIALRSAEKQRPISCKSKSRNSKWMSFNVTVWVIYTTACDYYCSLLLLWYSPTRRLMTPVYWKK